MSPNDAPAEAFPLAWPEGWARTPAHERTRSRFDVNETWARTHLVEQAEAAYRTLARIHHPDRGGDAERMAALNAAVTAARREARP